MFSFLNRKSQFNSTYFGKIDLKKLEDWYDSKIDFDGRPLEISITFLPEQKGPNVEELKKIDIYLDKISDNLNRMNAILTDDFNEDETAKEYVDILAEELDKEELVKNIDKYDFDKTVEENIFQNIILLRIVFYPDVNDKIFAVLDYSLGQEITDELLVVKLNKNNSVKIAIES